ncbi:MAG: response regulator transcription factor [Candidatus Yanofskybacteria bacterium]|nr:response regulator transcription factor [Candidatus Yanofskybacteria bacterium]
MFIVNMFNIPEITAIGLSTIISSSTDSSFIYGSRVSNISKIDERADSEDGQILILGVNGSPKPYINLTKDARMINILPIAWGRNLHAGTFLGAGAVGVIDSNATSKDFLDCLGSVVKGKIYAASSLGRKEGLAERLSKIESTTRETQILDLITKGKTNKEIANQLDLTEGSVKVYLSKIFKKFGASNRLELALAASQAGFGD